MNKKLTITLSILALITVAFVAALSPLDTYTTKYGCREETVVVARLSLLMGDSIEDVKKSDTPPAPAEGCSRTIKYVLYAL